MRRPIAAVALALLAVTSGCAGLAPATGGNATATESCTESAAEYRVMEPSKPDPLNRSAAVAFAEAFEKGYERARLRAEEENVTIQPIWFHDVSVRAVAGGFAVRVRPHVEWSTDEVNGKVGYPTNYTVTDQRFARGGRTLICWG